MIKRSRNFVCVRIDPYEKETNADWVRKLWQGRLTNSVFAILSPDGEQMETRGGRSPSMALGTGQELYDAMDRLAKKYPGRSDGSDAVVPDADSFAHILNTASCDQVALGTIVLAEGGDAEKVEQRLRSVVWHPSLHGLFHWDMVTAGDTELQLVGADADAPGNFVVIRPGIYGQDGEVIATLDLDAPEAELIAGLREAADAFVSGHQEKEYQAHVRFGKRQGETISQEVPYGEDRGGGAQPGPGKGGKR